MSKLAVDSGIYSAGLSEISSGVKIVVESTEVDSTENGDGGGGGETIVSERNESHSNYLKVPNNNRNNSPDNIRGTHKTQHRGSITSLAAEVLTPENITIVLKLRLVSTFALIICITSLLFVAPIVWYNVDQPSLELDSLKYDSLIRDICNVSTFLCVPLLHAHRFVFTVPLFVEMCIQNYVVPKVVCESLLLYYIQFHWAISNLRMHTYLGQAKMWVWLVYNITQNLY